METEVRDRRATWGAFEWPDFEEMFVERLDLEDLSDATVLDLGTGEGRLALHLAARAGRVVGIDTDAESLAAARDQSRALRTSNTTFLLADADTANYRLLVRSPIDVVVANHFMSPEAIRATAKALRPKGRFLFACHHRDHWIETGRVGHFSFSEEEMRGLLEIAKFSVRFLGVQRLVISYADLAELEEAHPELAVKFREDGRWEELRRRYAKGRAALTWSTLVGVSSRS